jgi:hypothetical protein
MSQADTMNAQGEAGIPTLAEMFPIPGEVRALERFLGTWKATGSLAMEGANLPMSGEWRFAHAAGGWGLVAELNAEIEGMGAYHEHDLVGFDVETGRLHIYSLTNTGAVHDHPAGWVNEDVMELEYEGTQGGKPYREVARVTFVSADRMQVESTDYIDGEQSSQMQLTLER